MNKTSKSSIDITSPKGSLIAQINVLRKQLKGIKQSKKDQQSAFNDRAITTIKQHTPKKGSKKLSKSKDKNNNSTTNLNKIDYQSSIKNDNFFRSGGSVQNQSILTPSLSIKRDLNRGSYAIQTNISNNQSILNQNIKQHSKMNIIDKQSPLCLNQIYYKQKDKKLKMDIELNKLRKIIARNQPQMITNQLNYVISLINISNKQYISKIQYFQKYQKNQDSEQNLLIKRQQNQISNLTRQVNNLQQIIRNLKRQINLKKKQEDIELQQLNDLSIFQKNQLRTHSDMLQTVIQQLQQKNIQLQEQNKIIQNKLLKRQQQIIMLNEDINYLRIQTQNYKCQKKQINQIYENVCLQFRNFKRSKQSQLEKINQQKQKWQKQCKLRRNQSQQITSLEQQKITLLKQITQLRNLLSLKSTQLDQKKSIMHQNQKKNILLQSQIYKIKAENQTLRNQKQYCQFQIQKLHEQIQDIKKYGKSTKQIIQRQRIQTKEKSTSLKVKHQSLQKQKNKNQNQQKQNYDQFYTTIHQMKRNHFSKQMKQKEEKLRALQDIHSMIKRHKNDMNI